MPKLTGVFAMLGALFIFDKIRFLEIHPTLGILVLGILCSITGYILGQSGGPTRD